MSNIQSKHAKLINSKDTGEMSVKKRNGDLETVSFDKILSRVKKMGSMVMHEPLSINYTGLTMKVIEQLYDGIKTTSIDELTSEECATMSALHPDYGKLASRIIISNHQKNTENSFTLVMKKLYDFKDIHGVSAPKISDQLYKIVCQHGDEIDAVIKYLRDFDIDFFGFKTLERAYLMRYNNEIIERPQHMWMRVSLGIHGWDLQSAFKTYELMSMKYFTHATPTLFNSGTPRAQMSSCYLLSMEDDSITGIYNTLGECASISKWAGGIGLHIHNVRSSGSHIRGTNGTSNGIVPMLRVFNNTARYVDQGGGKRNGSFAIYLEPWHGDIFNFLELKKNHGDEETKARDLFYALWIPDLFMTRVKHDGLWTLMCPDKCPGLSDVCGEKFEQLYTQYENEGRGNKTISARKLWFSILDSQIETGTPYMLYKDPSNMKSNQKNLGTIKSSNLCTEIIEYSNDEETAVCNLASIGLPMFIERNEKMKDLIDIDILDDEEKNVIIYSRKNCIYCKMVKYLMDTNYIEYDEINMDDDKDRVIFYDKYNVNSVPQVFINGEKIGGYKEFVHYSRPVFNYEKLGDVTRTITRNLNKVIDVNFYPTDKTRRSNLKHRPVGIGIQGLADIFAIMNLPFDCEEAREINRNIFETIYYYSLLESNSIAKERSTELQTYIPYLMGEGENQEEQYMKLKEKLYMNEYDEKYIIDIMEGMNTVSNTYPNNECNLLGSYSSFEGSPASKGVLQFDMWDNSSLSTELNYDWVSLKHYIKKYGLRNSLLVAPMPTASTSQILGNNECFEPFTSNLYTRGTNAGEFIIINKYLINELIGYELWSEKMKNKIILNKGSVLDIDEIPMCIREKYKIAWEIPMKSLIDMTADRGIFVCQSQSMNLWMENPDYNRLTAMHFYAWEKGLKTGIYYLRTKAKAAAQQFTIDPHNINKVVNNGDNIQGEPCESCSG